jgi:hypothetical protein
MTSSGANLYAAGAYRCSMLDNSEKKFASTLLSSGAYRSLERT